VNGINIQKKNSMKTILFLISVMIFTFNSLHGQDWKASLEKEKIYNNLTEALKNPLTVKRLHLTSYDSKWLPPDLFKLTNLLELTIHFSPIDNLVPDISRFLKLQVLNISYTEIVSLPEEIAELNDLRVLSLVGNKITQLPENIDKLTKLEELNLYDNQLVKLPFSISNLKFLRDINIGANGGLDAEMAFDYLKNISTLEKLNFENNNLNYIPVTIGFLTNLKELYLANNQLETLPIEIGSLAKLELLDLGESRGSYNKITSLPNEMENLINLKQLSIANNKLLEVPDCIYKLVSLERLDLSYNEISEIGAEIENLKNLNFLNVSYNKLESLPAEIGKLIRLKELIRYNNNISDKEEEKIVRYLTVNEVSASDSLLVEQNFQEIVTIVFDFHQGAIPGAKVFKLTLEDNILTFYDYNNKQTKKYTIESDKIISLKKEAYWIAYIFYKGTNDINNEECVGGSSRTLTVNDLIYKSSGCADFKYEEEINLFIKKLTDLIK